MHQQASQQYWPGHSSSTPATAAQNTLPTPPTDGTDSFKPPGQDLKTAYNDLAAPQVQQQPGMASNLESTGAPSSLTARRPAANNLPNFELPRPQFQPYHGGQPQKFGPLPVFNPAQNSSVNAGNLLTPPSNGPGDNLGPSSSGLSAVTTAQNISSTAYNNNYSWPALNTGLTPLGPSSGTGTTPQSWTNPSGQFRGLFSPSLTSSLGGGRINPNSPIVGDSLPAPPSWPQNDLPPLPTSLLMPGSSVVGSLIPQQNAMAQAYMAQNQTQTPTPVSATTTQASPVNGTDAFARPHSTPSAFYSQSQPTSAQQTSFPPFNHNSSPTEHSPMSAPPPNSRQSPFNAQSAHFGAPEPHNPYARPTYTPSYSMPYSMPPLSAPAQLTGSGSIMTNLHNPNAPMGLIGCHPGSMPYGYHSGTSAQVAQQLYGTQQQMPHNERPFKCDQCPQSFNRNHDLKRHKRIHLAVKPFPCGHCDKSFSRKDALKVCNKVSLTFENLYLLLPQRHILVKGCGRGGISEKQDAAPATSAKSEMSESVSPILDQNSL